jgi:protein-disulfide isomerase
MPASDFKIVIEDNSFQLQRTAHILPAMQTQFFRLALSICGLLLAAVVSAQAPVSSKSGQPIATVDGQSIYEADLLPSIQGQLLPLRNQEYEIKRKALDSVIEQKMLEAAAKKKGLSTEQLFVQEVDSKVHDPSDDEILGYYMALKDRVNRPFADVKAQLKESLKQTLVQQARQEYTKRLRGESKVVVLMSAPRIDVNYDPARVRGNPKAPVMIVEFSDYQCPYCHQVEPTVKALLAKYGDKVSLSYRDFPLTQIHSQAEIAAEASRCALEQGKFWEYHDQLFTASKLEKDSLIGYARDLKLDERRFEGCLTSEKYKADIVKDLQDGRKSGITGTPGFFINGIEASGNQPQDAFARIIDDELSRTH